MPVEGSGTHRLGGGDRSGVRNSAPAGAPCTRKGFRTGGLARPASVAGATTCQHREAEAEQRCGRRLGDDSDPRQRIHIEAERAIRKSRGAAREPSRLAARYLTIERDGEPMPVDDVERAKVGVGISLGEGCDHETRVEVDDSIGSDDGGIDAGVVLDTEEDLKGEELSRLQDRRGVDDYAARTGDASIRGGVRRFPDPPSAVT